MPRAPTIKAAVFLLSVNFVFAAGTYVALSAGTPEWTGSFKKVVFCLVTGFLAAMSASQITAKQQEEDENLFGWREREKEKEKESAVRNWEEKVRPEAAEGDAVWQEDAAQRERTGEVSASVEAPYQGGAEVQQWPAPSAPQAAKAQKDLPPKKILEMVKALAESAQIEDEETWAAVKTLSGRAAGAMAELESALEAALDASRRVRSALEELTARVEERLS